MSFISGVKHFRQEEDYTCVAACLRMTLDYWGVQRSEQDIAALTHTTITGIRLENSIAVVALGVEVMVDKATLTDLQRYLDEGKPCIVSVLSIHFLHYPCYRLCCTRLSQSEWMPTRFTSLTRPVNLHRM